MWCKTLSIRVCLAVGFLSALSAQNFRSYRTVAEITSHRSGEPLSLVGGDFDEDGVRDLVVLYGSGRQGTAVLMPAPAPISYLPLGKAGAKPASQRSASSPGRQFTLDLPDRPEFAAPLDWNGDRHSDVLFGSAGSRQVWIALGDGQGALASPQPVDLPGSLVSMAVEESDARERVVLTVERPNGPARLLFQGFEQWREEAGDAPALPSPAVGDSRSAVLSELPGRASRAVIAAGSVRLESNTGACGTDPVPSSVCMIVNDPSDKPDGDLRDGLCRVRDNPGGPLTFNCTLRAALEQAAFNNAQDLITHIIFSRQVVAVDVIDLGLPAITAPVFIDGSTAPGGFVALDGRLAFRAGAGFVVNSPNVHIRGFQITRFPVGVESRAGQPVALTALTVDLDPDNPNASSKTGTTCVRGTGLLIGTPAEADRVVLMNCGRGLVLNGNGGSVRNTVIGFFPDGTTPASTFFDAVEIADSVGARLGTPEPNGGNVIGQCRNEGCSAVTIVTRNLPVAGVRVENNFIGVNRLGTVSFQGNGRGISLFSTGNPESALGVNIGGDQPLSGNVVSGHKREGIFVQSSLNTQIQGNLIGLSPDGNAALGNGLAGLVIRGASRAIVGGPSPVMRNVISGNGAAAPSFGLDFQATASVVQGNYIGLDKSGTRAIPNTGGGVAIMPFNAVSGSILGGDRPELGNIVSGNSGPGVRLGDLVSAPVGFTARNNRIGVSPDGLLSLPNSGEGILATMSPSLVIEQNLVSGNRSHGLDIGGEGGFVRGNLVGLSPAGVPLGNGGDGVRLGRDARGVTITANSIFFNGGDGIRATDRALDNGFFANAIFRNAGLGLSQVRGPFLTATVNEARTSGASTAIRAAASGLLGLPAGTAYFYASEECDPSGFGEGQSFLGSVDFVPSSGAASILFSAPQNLAGRFITANLTAPTGGLLRSGVFSNCQAVAGLPCASDVTAQVRIERSGFRFNRVTGRWTQSVVLTNLGPDLTDGVSLLIGSLNSAATLFQPSGTANCFGPPTPFRQAASRLASGEQVLITLEFINPSNAAIAYVPRVVAGAGER
ncbi:MAG TPA: hypothetical protein DEH78_23905 [Solibacterales bacterium]|nr:hypothetical protein [Bryobacterales bacterium]